MRLSKLIYSVLIIHIGFCGCDGFNWFGGINMEDCNVSDINVIDTLIIQSKETIEWDMDINFDGKIVECSWDLRNNEWIYMRTRLDKTAPNFVTVYENTVMSINDNITSEDILKLAESCSKLEENMNFQ